MEPELAALASTVGTTVVTLLATEGWERARDGMAALWRRVRPDRAETVAAELEAAREDLLDARSAGDDAAEGELRAEWEGRVRRLLREQPDVAEELRRLVAELAPERGTSVPVVTQHATASGRARIYQAGRDQHISER